MSELNRLLTELSPKQHGDQVTAASIPTPWGFRLARVALALFATLLCVTGIAWAVSVGSEKMQATTVETVIEPVVAASPDVDKTLPSPTLKVVSKPLDYVAKHKETSAIVADETATLDLALADVSKAQPAPKAQTLVEEQVVPKVVAQPKKVAAVTPESVVKTTVIQVKPVEVEPKLEAVLEPETASISVETIELTGEQLAAIAYEKAQKRAQVGDNQKAISHLRDAVKYHPEHVDATNQLAALLFGRNQVREAERVLRKGIADNPYSASLKLTLARVYQKSGREESALNILSVPVNTLDSDVTRVVAMRAALAQKLGEHVMASSSYQWLTEHDPADGRWWLGLGVSSERQKQYLEAKKAYHRAMKAGGLSQQSMNFARDRLAYLAQVQQGAANGN